MESMLSWLNQPLSPESGIRLWMAIAAGLALLAAILVGVLLGRRMRRRPKAQEPVTLEPKKQPVLDSISAVLNDEKIYVGDNIADKITVTAHYTEGKEDQKVTGFTVDPANFSTAGEHQVTITYTEGGVKKETTLKVTVTARYTVKVTWNQSQGSVKINGTEYKDGSKELEFDADADVTIQAIAATGFEFDKFSGSSIGSSSKDTYTISKLNQNVDIQVIFKQAEPEEPEVSEIEIDWTKSCGFKRTMVVGMI